MGVVPSHEQLDNDFNIDFRGNIMTHITNHIDGKQSGHFVLRELFVKLLMDNNPTIEKYHFDLGSLTDELLQELRELLKEWNIKFDWSWNTDDLKLNKFHDYSKKSPCNEETARNWMIEKKYLSHWLSKAMICDDSFCVVPSGKNDKRFCTDGQRIASVYAKKHLLKSSYTCE
jgi:hypothetical protein